MRGLEIEKQSKQWLKDDGEFVPHPTTWLNQMRWVDAIASAAPKAKASRAEDVARRILEGK
jgi:hypothetical protein